MSYVIVTSFGYGHPKGAPAGQHLTVDLRHLLYNPHHDPALRDLTGMDGRVFDQVMETEGAQSIVNSIVDFAVAALRCPRREVGPILVAVGCTGGRHRSVVIASEVVRQLDGVERVAVLVHRDVHKAVLPSGAHRGA